MANTFSSFGFGGITIGGNSGTPPSTPSPLTPSPPDVGGTQPTNTTLLRQAGVQLNGPISFGGQNASDNGATTSGNNTSFSFDGIKGAYNANINQNFVNGITSAVSSAPNDVTVPLILYGDSGATPQPLNQNISLKQFLNTDESDRQRISEPGYGGFNLGTSPQTLNSSVSGPFSFGEVRGRVPNDPLAVTGNGTN